MNSPGQHYQKSVPLNGADDSAAKPLKDVVICFTSVPYEKRVREPQLTPSSRLYMMTRQLLTFLLLVDSLG